MKRSTFPFALFAVLVAGCAAAPPDQPPPEHVLGKYTFHETGKLVKHPWILDAVLVLERDAQFTLEVNFNIDNDDEHETFYGSVHVEGDKVILHHADGGDHNEIHEFVMEGNTLKPKLGWGARLALKGLKFDPVFVKAE